MNRDEPECYMDDVDIQPEEMTDDRAHATEMEPFSEDESDCLDHPERWAHQKDEGHTH